MQVDGGALSGADALARSSKSVIASRARVADAGVLIKEDR